MSRVRDVLAWEALDSRGTPTVAARIVLDDGVEGTAIAPSGASAGSHEAVELRDGGTRHRGRGVLAAVGNVRDRIRPALLGRDGMDPAAVDALLTGLDPVPGFAGIGANAVLAVSLAAWRAAASARRVSLARLLQPTGPLELPMPMVNVVSGGAHAGGVIDVQDLLVIPHGAADLPTAIEQVVAVRRAAQDLALERGFREAVLVADEGGLGLRLAGNRAALELLTTAIARAGLEPGVDASIAIDVAATEWAHGDGYELASEGRRIDAATLVAELAEWADSSPIVSIEDPLAEDDWDGWHAIGSRLGDRVQLLGDDLFATDPARLARGIREGVADAVLVKVNQNGTVSGAHRVVETARAAGYATVVSARSGDTEESWLADLAAGWRAGQIKVGSTHRSERNAKWNRLLELAATEETVFAGPWPISPGTGRARPPRRMS